MFSILNHISYTINNNLICPLFGFKIIIISRHNSNFEYYNFKKKLIRNDNEKVFKIIDSGKYL